jgi:hypothetical protein
VFSLIGKPTDSKRARVLTVFSGLTFEVRRTSFCREERGILCDERIQFWVRQMEVGERGKAGARKLIQQAQPQRKEFYP